jgi:chaperonin GroEL (HSP60 family)
LIAGRGHADIADLAVEAARVVGRKALDDPGFRLADCVVAAEGAHNEVFVGVIVDKSPMNKQMPKDVRAVKVMVTDDALEPERIEDDALATEAGFAKYMELKDGFRCGVRAIIDLGVGLVVTDKAVDDEAEEMLTEAGAMVIRRASSRDMARIVEHTGARTIKRGGLKRPAEELKRALGRVKRVTYDERLEHLRIVGGKGKPMATILVGAATEEVKAERERIAHDAASAVQQALLGGVVAGGGAAELAAAPEVERLRDGIKGMAAYGVDCVVAALKRPLTQIAANAGFNPLEKIEDVIAASANGATSRAIDCDTGEVADMLELGVVDPTPVKVYALRAAGEVAEAVLRINTIIRKRDQAGAGPTPATGETTQTQPR